MEGGIMEEMGERGGIWGWDWGWEWGEERVTWKRGGPWWCLRALLTDGFICRIEPHGPDYELVGVPIYGVGGVVGRREGHIARYVPRHAPPRLGFGY